MGFIVVDTLDIADLAASQLRRQHYNAEVVGLEMIHDDLMILRVRPDGDPLREILVTSLHECVLGQEWM